MSWPPIKSRFTTHVINPQDGNSTVVSNVSKRGHNERYHDVEEYERKVRKRRARLVSAAEESFTHIRRMREEVMTGRCGVGCHITFHLAHSILKHFTFCSLREPQASVEPLPGGPGCLPESESVSPEISAGHKTTAQTHDGVHTTTPLNLPQLRHVTQSLPREILDHCPRVTGKYLDQSL